MTMFSNSQFSKFGKGQNELLKKQSRNAIIYTRVSSKDQETNFSLTYQLKVCTEYAEKTGYTIHGLFGGTYESAKTDERKEFNRMLSFVKKSKENISTIIVYTEDRFSRTGANAIYIASELKKQGVMIVAASSPVDSSTPAGTLHQNIKFIFSQFDNEQRRERCMAGTRERLLKGYWSGPVPLGYEQYSKGKEQFIQINEKGKLLKNAFQWKLNELLTNKEIAERLKVLGFKVTEKRISEILHNPFYCGLIAHKALKGQLIEGRHEALISRDTFLKVNQILEKFPHGYSHEVNKTNELLSLKNFVLCAKCGTNMTGYLNKRKNLYYYKCNKNGCRCNKSAKKLNLEFQNLLGEFKINEKYTGLLQKTMLTLFKETSKDETNTFILLQNQLKDVECKLFAVNEKYALSEITKDVFESVSSKFLQQKEFILDQLKNDEVRIHRIHAASQFAFNLVLNPAQLWTKGNFEIKQRLQKLLFTQGVVYNKISDSFIIKKYNRIFTSI